MRPLRTVIRIILLVLLALVAPSFIRHLLWLTGGSGLSHIISGRWDIAAANILFFMLFIILLRYRRKVDWRSHGVYSAFIIALFAEMYGFPLTAYFVANYFGEVPVEYKPSYELSINAFGVGFALPTMMLIGSALTIAGLILVILGWYRIYSSNEALVTGGVYKLARHPQYTGILLVTFGWVLHWPTILTIIMWPILAASYLRLAREEEEELKHRFPEEFEAYKKKTPMFI